MNISTYIDGFQTAIQDYGFLRDKNNLHHLLNALDLSESKPIFNQGYREGLDWVVMISTP